MNTWPSITPEFMAAYDHATPSGTRHPGCKINQLAFLGTDCRAGGSPIDLNLLCDRSYDYLWETSDDGWLVGGGETDKLPRPDTAHAEMWRLGPGSREQGGLPHDEVHAIIRDQIQFGPLVMKPWRVNFTPASELELLFHFEPESTIGRLFALFAHVFACPCGDYGNPFHITLVRGAKFRSDDAQAAYFEKVGAAVEGWNRQYPHGLTFADGGFAFFAHREKILHAYPPTLANGVQWAG